MKAIYFLIVLLLMQITVSAQSFIGSVIGKYNGTLTHTCPSLVTENGVLYLLPSGSYSVAVWENDSSSTGLLGEPWDILVKADSTLIRYPGINQYDTAAAFGKLYSNDSIHLKIKSFSNPICYRTFNGFKIYSIAGLNETYTTKSLSIYPQPATDDIHIQYLPESVTEGLEIYDLQGSKVDLVINRINSHSFKTNVSFLRNGVYFIIARTEKGIIREKLIVQH